ncbi:response regulator [Microcoleus sp. A003_D6]|uniref:hybrid sensor histidine kinase/response regulator n=1 Tax=Microcoleus sp. A003_D6 TaxID=3055266 RepID=UPI002FD489C3
MALENSISTVFDNSIIMIVDDMPNNLKVLSSVLADAGLEVAIATSGQGALQQLEHTPVSLILLDVMMPGIDGFETCRRIKANPKTQNIPVIFITALSEAIDKVQGFDLGAVDYITKPFQQGEVLARVRTHLKLNQLSRILEFKNTELQQLTEKLEQRVMERTHELFTQKRNLEQALLELQKAQIQLVKSEKMSALGNLVAGIAHEMNNPLGFIFASLKQVKPTLSELVEHLRLYQKSLPNPSDEIQDHAVEIDLDYSLEDLPKVINAMGIACDRLKGISTSLCTFSRADKDYKVPFNIHEGIDSTLLILKHRLKANEQRPAIEVITEYGKFPQIECFPGQLNQVFMNILANAIDALDESNQGMSYTSIANKIFIKTELALDRKQVIIRIKDNGFGMSEYVREKIFDDLFTTKGVGKGTGLGLAIAHQIVVEKHGGAIDVNSAIGQGTEFAISLPVCSLN